MNATINGTAFVFGGFVLGHQEWESPAAPKPEHHGPGAVGAFPAQLRQLPHHHAKHAVLQRRWIRGVYFFVLLTHILLSIVIVPLVLTTYLLGLGNQIQRHRKGARITWPIWMYVTFTGVVVYLLISPCYPF